VDRGLRYIVYPAFSAVAWASNIVAGRYLVGGGFVDGFSLSFARFAIATPILYIVMRVGGGGPGLKGGLARLILIGFLGVALFNAALYSSLAYITAAAASFIASTATLFTYLIAFAIGRVRVGYRAIVGIITSILGVYVLLRSGIRVWGFNGILLALTASLSWSIYTIIVDSLQESYNPGETLFWAMLFGTIMLAPAFRPDTVNTMMDPIVAVLIVYVAVVPGLLGYLLWNIGVERLGPALPSIFIPVIPLMATIMEALLLGVKPSRDMIVGGLLIVTGILVILYERFRT